jgi:hypothetical protein
MQSILNTPVSYYPSISSTGNGVTVNLLDILTSTQHQQAITKLRAESDEEKQKALKATLPCYTVAGVFSTRSNSGLITPSGLACVDLDAAENHDVPYLLNQLKNIPTIAYAGLSCRGKRLFLIIPFATNAYQKHYDMLIETFTKIGLPMGDNCHRAISQPRLISYNTDDTHWFNHHAQPFAKLPPVKKVHVPKRLTLTTKPSGTFADCVAHTNKTQSFEKGNRHAYIKALAGYCKWKGLSENDTLNGCLEYVEAGFPASEVKAIVRYFFEPEDRRPRTDVKQPTDDRRPRTEVKLPTEDRRPRTEAKAGEKMEVRRPKTEVIQSVPVAAVWKQLPELEVFFSTTQLPQQAPLNKHTHILDCRKFVDDTLVLLKAQYGKRVFLPYLERLVEFRASLHL